jgi:predicted phosphodiesterase
MKWYVTGDTHGNNEARLKQFEKNEDQIALIILGDSSVNYALN